MTTNIEIVNAAAVLIIKAAILAARFSGRARKRSLKRLACMDIDDKDKEVIFLRDKVYQDIKIEGSILAFSLSFVHPSEYYSTASAAYSFFKEQSFINVPKFGDRLDNSTSFS